jgi:uncharacterized protein (TIGR03437 family)
MIMILMIAAFTFECVSRVSADRRDKDSKHNRTGRKQLSADRLRKKRDDLLSTARKKKAPSISLDSYSEQELGVSAGGDSPNDLNSEDKSIELYDKPREAFEYYRQKRLPEGETQLPIEKYFDAFEKMSRMPHFSSALDRSLEAREWKEMSRTSVKDSGIWSQLGPGNIGGRTRSILINPLNPQIMYAAGVSGGVWKTNDAGASWYPITDFIGNLTVGSMAMDPSNPDTILVGTGEGVVVSQKDTVGDFRGAGIFKTTDGGMTWTRLENTKTADFYYVNDIVISPLNRNRIYAATRTGVWRSLDAGLTWENVHNPPGQDGGTINGGCFDLAIRSDVPGDYVLAACGTFEQSTVYRNTKAAETLNWISVLTERGMGRTALAIAPSDQNVVYAIASSIENNNYRSALYAVFRSGDGGSPGSWTSQTRNSSSSKFNSAILSTPPLAFFSDCGYGSSDDFSGQAWYDLVIAVDPVDSNRVWIGGIDIFRSDDGGINWGLAGPVYKGTSFELGPIHPDQHVLVFHPRYNGTTNRQLFVGNDGGLYRTDNALGSVLTTIGSYCTAEKSGIDWISLNNNYGVTQFYFGLATPDGKSYIGGTQDNGTLMGTDERGVNGWREINGGDGGYVAIDPNSPLTIFASYTSISIRKSTDGGATFGSATSGIEDFGLFISPFVLDPSEPSRIWTGGNYIWRSVNGGARWVQASSLTSGGSQVSAIAAAPGDAKRVIAGMGDGYILRTDDGLTANSETFWSPALPRRGFVSSIYFDPVNSDIVYATYSTFGGTHVWRSLNGGASWSALDGSGSGALPDIPVHTIVADPANTARLYLGTDAGVFVSSDAGASWAVENSGFANVITESLQMHIANGVSTLYAFTYGRGAWRVTINNNSCNYSLPTATLNLNASASNGTIDVKAGPSGCNWTASSRTPWLKVGGEGSSDGKVSYSVEANKGLDSRIGTALIAGKTLTVIQPGLEDREVPLISITNPVPSVPVNNITGLINLAGRVSDNSGVREVRWETSRGASGIASLGFNRSEWSAISIPLAPGHNQIIMIALDQAGNVGRAFLNVNSSPASSLVTVAGTGASGLSSNGTLAVSANITRPIRIDIDGAGNLYLTDSDNQIIRKVTPEGAIITVAGNGIRGYSGDGGPAIKASLSFPIGVAVDLSGNIYICDNGNNRIRKVSATNGVITTLTGTGTQAYSGDGGPAIEAQLNSPQNVAVDNSGNVYISDFGNSRIRKVTISDGTISTVAGSGVIGFDGDGGPATSARLNSPNNVFADKNGNLIICDAGNSRIRRVNSSDGKISTIVGNGTRGYGGDGGPAAEALINVPAGAITDQSGNLFFSDRANHRVRKVDAQTGLITTVAGSGRGGFNGDGLAAPASDLNFPTGLAMDPAGNLYIGDRDNLRIRKLINALATDNVAPYLSIESPTTSTSFTTTSEIFSASGKVSDNSAIIQISWSNDRGGSGLIPISANWSVRSIPLQLGLNNLSVTAWDASGNVSTARIAVNYNPERIITTLAGTGEDGDTGDGSSGLLARLSLPTSVAVDNAGNVYLADSGNHRIRKIMPGGIIVPFAGNGNLGSSGDGGLAVSAALNNPQSVTLDSTGNVYIADTNNNRIRKVTPAGIISTVAGTGRGGFTGDGGPADKARLNSPYGVALDGAGNLFIADTANFRIRKVAVSSGLISTVAGNGSFGNSGDNGPAVDARLNTPYSVAISREGNLFIVDVGDHKVRRVSPDGIITRAIGTGTAGYSGDGGPAASAQIDTPTGIGFDSENNLYLADLGNNRIRKVSTAGIISTFAGNGIPGFAGDGGSPLSAQLSLPSALAFDSSGRLYLADYGNLRIRMIIAAGSLNSLAVFSAASYHSGTLAPESIGAVFGRELSVSAKNAESTPLPVTLEGLVLRIADSQGVVKLAPLFYVSSGQVNFQVPAGTYPGTATITVNSAGGNISTGTMPVANVSPGIFSANSNGQGVAAAFLLRIKPDLQQVYEPVSTYDASTGRYNPVPIDLGPEGDTVYLIMFGTGFRNRISPEMASVDAGGQNAEILYLGAQGDFTGLDQLNIRLDRNLRGRGDINIKCMVEGIASNSVSIRIK